jgi:hypothetical protein
MMIPYGGTCPSLLLLTLTQIDSNTEYAHRYDLR